MTTYNYQNLRVWRQSMDLVESVYVVTSKLPKKEVFALADQIQRSAVSVPSNIAEGQKRINRPETMHFTGIALGSLAELETQLIICSRVYGLNVDDELEACVEIGKMLTSLLKSLRSKL